MRLTRKIFQTYNQIELFLPLNINHILIINKMNKKRKNPKVEEGESHSK